MTKATADTLHHLTDFDSPFRIAEGGYIKKATGIYAPDLLNDELSGAQGWEFINGFSGQDRYAGPIMHESEYLGGGMAQYVLDNPGVYVLVAAYYDPEDEAEDSAVEIHGWALVRLKENSSSA